ncbi:MAG: hypothetical protein GEV09_14300 [Pseudonocardiaceae bacterium]|nr:hypothetical protein [Pseudonocardiaceae bacterium]
MPKPKFTPEQARAAAQRATESLTPAQRTQRARIAALARWSREDPTPNGERAQTGLRNKFRREVLDADPTVLEPELTRRADCAYRAHMQRLSFRQSRNRQQQQGGGAA